MELKRLNASDKPRWPCPGTNYHEHATEGELERADRLDLPHSRTAALRQSPAFPTQAQALRRLRRSRFHLYARSWCALGMCSAFGILVNPWAVLGVGVAALGFFVTCIWSGYHTFKDQERPTFPPTAPFDDRNLYIRNLHRDD